mgnify:CR=1 FL=1
MNYEIENIELKNYNKLAHEKIKQLEKELNTYTHRVVSFNPEDNTVAPYTWGVFVNESVAQATASALNDALGIEIVEFKVQEIEEEITGPW